MEKLIKELIKSGALKTENIIEAFRKIDRADFVASYYRPLAHQNSALPTLHGQTISQPYTVALMLELLSPKEGDKILDVGSGSGWQTAMLANIVGPKGRVFGIEVIPEVKNFGEENISKYNFVKKGIVKLFNINAENGLPEEAPFDRIISAASGKKVPPAWKKQLKIGGRMVLPIKESIHLLIKKGENDFEEKEFPGFVFVPFVRHR